ncbi:hypothetical protein [Rubritalea tangerina]|uniref:hypothetical protein n=1 Tax=Rubritalea tangerina TaxID=430798 RepID=UPI00360B2BA4
MAQAQQMGLFKNPPSCTWLIPAALVCGADLTEKRKVAGTCSNKCRQKLYRQRKKIEREQGVKHKTVA